MEITGVKVPAAFVVQVVHSDGPQPQAPVATPDRWRKDGADKGPQDVNGLQAMATT